MKIEKFLFWLGVAVMVAGLLGVAFDWIRELRLHIYVVNMNFGSLLVTLMSPLWQGGVLIALSKILERLRMGGN